jgi:hypothetical protein
MTGSWSLAFTPEFTFEKDRGNISKAVQDLKITYPIAIDSDYAIWRAFHNQYWPAHYFIDANGRNRLHHFGEGEYDKSEQVIQQLLIEKNSSLKTGGFGQVAGSGVQATADLHDVGSPETYVGYGRQENFRSPEKIKRDSATAYTAPGSIVFRFHARDLHLVLGPGKDGKPVRFRILIDGLPPGEDRGVDVNAQGEGTVREYRLYQLVRQQGKIEDRTFQIEFLDRGVQAYAFTFG